MSPHRVDPSRGGKDDDYRDGYRAGAASVRRAAGGNRGGGRSPQLGGCLPGLIVIAALIAIAIIATRVSS